jgi:hypothetical protein
MDKFKALSLFVVLAVVAAGIFGAVHDQISYTVSHEYFTRFKFRQFGLLDESVPARWRAAEVGIRASWWMGIPLGLLTGVAGLIQKSAEQMRKAMLWSLVFIVGFTLASALCGLLYGYVQTEHFDPLAYRGWYVPRDLEHPRNFLCAGYMHNAAYLGGLLAIPAAWLFHWAYKGRSGHGTT